ncbi:MAG: septation protein IspZ, partial [Pseudomonadota bacterium]
GALNLYVAYNFDNDTWVNFKVFGLTGLNFLFMIVLIAWLSRHIRDHADDNVESTDNSSNHPPSA